MSRSFFSQPFMHKLARFVSLLTTPVWKMHAHLRRQLQRTFASYYQTLDAHFCPAGTLSVRRLCIACKTTFFYWWNAAAKTSFLDARLFLLRALTCVMWWFNHISKWSGNKGEKLCSPAATYFAGCLEQVHIRGALGWKEAKRPLILRQAIRY